MLSDAIAIFRSVRRRECADRAFMLTAVGVPNEMTREAGYYVLWVDAGSFAAAQLHLARYQEENRPPPPPAAPYPLAPHAALGSALYGLVLFAVAYGVGVGLWRLDAFSRGELAAARVQEGQWWRAWTALTLHLDPAHLALNLGAGAWFGYLCGRLLGPGIAWALIVVGAGLANLLEALLADPQHVSVGASTAVFTALGLLSAYAWRERRLLSQHWASELAPLVVGVVLLGWFGTEGEHTDVMAHLAGFLVGAVLGVLATLPRMRRVRQVLPQWLAGLVALGVIALAWICALSPR